MFPVSDEQIARYLGLERLRVGARSGTGRGQVLAWWWVNVGPSFDHNWAVGAIHEEEWTCGPTSEVTAIRGFVADADGAAVVALTTDSALMALGTLNPFRVEPTTRQRVQWGEHEAWVETRTADGLAYWLRWGTRATEGTAFFANPEAGWLVEFERVLFRFARQVVSKSKVRRFQKQLRTWIRYRKELREEDLK
jgi:hypothetical protein